MACGINLGVLLTVEVFGFEERLDPQNRIAVNQQRPDYRDLSLEVGRRIAVGWKRGWLLHQRRILRTDLVDMRRGESNPIPTQCTLRGLETVESESFASCPEATG